VNSTVNSSRLSARCCQPRRLPSRRELIQASSSFFVWTAGADRADFCGVGSLGRQQCEYHLAPGASRVVGKSEIRKSSLSPRLGECDQRSISIVIAVTAFLSVRGSELRYPSRCAFGIRRHQQTRTYPMQRLDLQEQEEVGRAGLEPATLGLKVPCSTS
jgi:hypothetical protein